VSVPLSRFAGGSSSSSSGVSASVAASRAATGAGVFGSSSGPRREAEHGDQPPARGRRDGHPHRPAAVRDDRGDDSAARPGGDDVRGQRLAARVAGPDGAGEPQRRVGLGTALDHDGDRRDRHGERGRHRRVAVDQLADRHETTAQPVAATPRAPAALRHDASGPQRAAEPEIGQ
jgi:hypothetical protein